MVRRFKALTLAATVAAAMFAFVPAHAEDYDCTVDGSSEDNPALLDNAGDYSGVTAGGASVVPTGDVWREGSDIVKVWLDDTIESNNKNVYVNIQVVDLLGVEQNAAYSFEWTTFDADDVPTVRFVYATVTRPGNPATNTPPTMSYTTGTIEQGAASPELKNGPGTTGSVDLDNNVIRIKLHRTTQVRDFIGQTLSEVTAQSHFFAGYLSGVYLEADTTEGDPCYDMVL